MTNDLIKVEAIDRGEDPELVLANYKLERAREDKEA